MSLPRFGLTATTLQEATAVTVRLTKQESVRPGRSKDQVPSGCALCLRRGRSCKYEDA